MIEPILILEAGAVKLDRLARQVTVNGAPVHLAPNVYALLEVLLLHQGEVLNIEEIARLSGVTLSSVLPYITKLRRIVGPGLVHTVRTEGYTIDKKG